MPTLHVKRSFKKHTLLLLALVCPLAAQAWEPRMEVGLGAATYSETVDVSLPTFTFRGTMVDWPVYLVGNYEHERVLRFMGQGLAESNLISLGLGVSQRWGKFSVFTELAYVDLDSTYSAKDIDELAYTYLVGRHAVGDREIPLDEGCAYTEQECYTAEYEIEDSAYSLTVGAGWQVWQNVRVTASYRFMDVDTLIAIKANPLERAGWWQEKDKLDYGKAEITILYTY